MNHHLDIALSDFHSSDAYTTYLSDITALIQLYMKLEKYKELVKILDYYLQNAKRIMHHSISTVFSWEKN